MNIDGIVLIIDNDDKIVVFYHPNFADFCQHSVWRDYRTTRERKHISAILEHLEHRKNDGVTKLWEGEYASAAETFASTYTNTHDIRRGYRFIGLNFDRQSNPEPSKEFSILALQVEWNDFCKVMEKIEKIKKYIAFQKANASYWESMYERASKKHDEEFPDPKENTSEYYNSMINLHQLNANASQHSALESQAYIRLITLQRDAVSTMLEAIKKKLPCVEEGEINMSAFFLRIRGQELSYPVELE